MKADSDEFSEWRRHETTAFVVNDMRTTLASNLTALRTALAGTTDPQVRGLYERCVGIAAAIGVCTGKAPVLEMK